MPGKQRRFHHVALSVFVKEGEQVLDVLAALRPLLPFDADEFFRLQWRNDPDREETRIYDHRKQQARLIWQHAHGFEDAIEIIELYYKKITHTNGIFDAIVDGLSKEDCAVLKNEALQHIDEDGRLFIRLDKNELADGKISLTTGGNCVKCTFSIAAYPKNAHAIRTAAKKLLGGIA